MTAANLAPEIEPLVLAVLEKRVGDAKAAARAAIEGLYAEGAKNTIRSPLDQSKLGSIFRTDPDPKWQITNRDLLVKHLEQDPDNREFVDEIVGTEDQVLEVLLEHAPQLLARVARVSADAIKAATARAAAGEAVPGISKVKPRGVLTIRPDKNAGVAIDRLVAAKVISWDGRVLELPAAGETVPVPDDCPGCGMPVDDPDDDPAIPEGWHGSCWVAQA